MTGGMKYNASARFHAKTSNIEEAEKIAIRCKEFFEEYGECDVYEIEKYWKLPEFYEIFLNINIHTMDKKTILDISKKIGDQITFYEDDFVWNKPENSTFLDPIVEWGCFDSLIETDLE